METQFVWNERYEIGVTLIDQEHKKLFHILNKLFHFGQQEEKSHWACQEAVKYFKDHTLQHFANEEDYMASIDYKGLVTHKRIHKNFRERTLPALERELEQTNYSENSISHFLGVCAGWLVGHTLVEDQLIVSGNDVKHWENLLPEEEQTVMGQTIANLLHSMFQLNPQLISNCYGGEKFGNGIYDRLIYRSKDQKKLEFFLIFEEPMIIHAVGSVTDRKAAAVSVMLIHVAGYLARHLAERTMQFFAHAEEFTLKDEQILTYEQFQRVYEKQSPQFSLLFDTGKGYFAYCAAASGPIRSENGVWPITENAMAEIDKCFRKNPKTKPAAGKKKRLLVVDDSDFMLKAMISLLENDYEVTTAKSGLSAIRSMTLTRPDLILLDYEMPVCNGKQVLEMIRSEKEFTAIPVMFLTNKVDPVSVKSAIALKPEGYLLKSLSTECVKKEIDLFFEKQKHKN